MEHILERYPVHKHVYVVFIQLLVAWWLTHFQIKPIIDRKNGVSVRGVDQAIHVRWTYVGKF